MSDFKEFDQDKNPNEFRYSYSWNQQPPTEQPSEPPRKKNNGQTLGRIIAIVLAVAVVAMACYGAWDLFGNSTLQQFFQGNTAPITNQPDNQTPSDNSGNSSTSDDSSSSSSILAITPTTGSEMSSVDIIAKTKPWVVGIVSSIYNQGSLYAQASGSGIIMSSDGYIITNQHVIDQAGEIQVVFEDGTKYDATLVGQDQSSDLAVVKIDATGLDAAEFGDSDKLQVGEKVIAIGNPLGMELFGTATQGIVSAINRDLAIEDRIMTLIQTDASINSGNSGGPLINSHGQVVGINSVKIATSSVDGLGFSIPINSAKPVIDELIEYGYYRSRPTLGITGYNVDEMMAYRYSIPLGVLITEIQDGSGAQKAGLQAYDTITAIDGVSITSYAELNAEKNKHKVGDTVTLTVYRSGKSMDVPIVLGESQK